MKTQVGKWLAGAAMVVAANVASADGDAAGLVRYLGYDAATKITYIGLDSSHSYIDNFGFTNQPFDTTNSDAKCQGNAQNSSAGFSTTDTTLDTKTLTTMLTTAYALKKGIVISSVGCVTVGGVSGPRIVSVELQ